MATQNSWDATTLHRGLLYSICHSNPELVEGEESAPLELRRRLSPLDGGGADPSPLARDDAVLTLKPRSECRADRDPSLLFGVAEESPQYLNRYDTLIKICRPSLRNELRVRSRPSDVRSSEGSRFCRSLL